jgi:hypothetical protein
LPKLFPTKPAKVKGIYKNLVNEMMEITGGEGWFPMGDQSQQKRMTATDKCEKAGVRSNGKIPTVEHPQAHYDLSLTGRAALFISIENSDLYHALRRSMATKNFSVPQEGRWPAATLNNPKNNLKAIAQIKPDPTEVEPFLPEDGISEWQRRTHEYVRCMDDLTADVLDVISAEWLKQASHPESMVTLTVDDFLRYRGLNTKKGGTGRRGGYHAHLRDEIARHINILVNTWIRVFEREVTVESEGKRGRKRVKWAGESCAIIVSSRVGPVNPSGEVVPRAWKIRPGDVFAQFLIGPGRQTALISQLALHYDPYRQYWEKRITRFLAYLWRIRGGRNNYLAPTSVGALLHGAGLQVDKRNPRKTRNRLEKALDRLRHDGVIRSWFYLPQVSGEKAVRIGWLEGWVSRQVQIEPPQEIVEQYDKINQPPASKKRLLAPKK